MLMATSPKQIKVMLVQFIDPLNNQPSVLFVFYYFLNNKENRLDMISVKSDPIWGFLLNKLQKPGADP